MKLSDFLEIANKYNIEYVFNAADTEVCYLMPGSNWYIAKYYTDLTIMSLAITFHYDDRAKCVIPDQWSNFGNYISPTDFEKKVQDMLVALKTEENNEELKKISEDFA